MMVVALHLHYHPREKAADRVEVRHCRAILSCPHIVSCPHLVPQAPQWMKRPAGATFGFGGKLVSFSNQKALSTDPVTGAQVWTV